MATRTSVLLIVCHVIRIASATDKQCAKYCRPENTTCFPSPTEWKALAEQLTDGQDALYKVPTNAEELEALYKSFCVYDESWAATPFSSANPYATTTVGFSADLVDYMDSLPWNYDDFKARLNTTLPSDHHHRRPDDELAEHDFVKDTFSWVKMFGFHGLCFGPDNGQYVGLDESKGLNLPAYTVAVKNADDVSAALSFAKRHELQVSVKNTGHSYNSASTAKGSLMIWTALMGAPSEKPTIDKDFRNTCGQHISELADGFGRVEGDVPQAVIKYAAGAAFREVIAAANEAGFFMVTGDRPSVGPGGGWVMGSGISFASRHLGFGVDNVVSFDAVLANGTKVTADACSNTGLFWALRGGGGGSFAVVTHVTYKLWTESAIQDVRIIPWAALHGKDLNGMCQIARFKAVSSFLNGNGIFSMDTLQYHWPEQANLTADHDFSKCPSGVPDKDFSNWLPDAAQFGQDKDGRPNQELCVAVKTMHLCGEWAELIMEHYTGADPRWGAHQGAGEFQFRGTRAEAHETWLSRLDKFWDFPGAVEIASTFWNADHPSFAGTPSSAYVVREFQSFKDFRFTGDPGGPGHGLLDTYTYNASGECPSASSSGECVKEWIESGEYTKKQSYLGPTTGLQFTDNYPNAFTLPPGLNPNPAHPLCFGIIKVSSMRDAKADPIAFEYVVEHLAMAPVSYFFGGKQAQVAPDAMGIGPQHRKGTMYSPFIARWNCDMAINKPAAYYTDFSTAVPTGGSSSSISVQGAAFNHWALDGLTNETSVANGEKFSNFEKFAWGSNAEKLKRIKDELDPTHMFNSRSTFGYRPVCDVDEPAPSPPPPSPAPRSPPVDCPEGCVPKKPMRALLFASTHRCPEGCVPA